MAFLVCQELICKVVLFFDIISWSGASFLVHLLGFKASIALFTRYRAKTAPQRGRFPLVLAHCSMFFLHGEWSLTTVRTESDLRWAFVRLLAARIEHL